MFDLKYLLLVAAAAAVLPRGGARSIELSVELSDMINKTICAIDVRYDEDRDRIPHLIKVITCAANTDQGCKANGIVHHHCCHHENKMECVEMRDSVLVFNKKLNATQTIEVSVGCACMIRNSSAALGSEPGQHGR